MLQALAPGAVPPAKPQEKASPASAKPRPFVKKWTMIDLEGLLGAGLEGGRSYENGQNLIRQATCLECHRFNQEGSEAGLDLSLSVTKSGPSELLSHIIEPGKQISASNAQHEVTLKDGGKVVGRIVKLTANEVMLNLDMRKPDAVRSIDRSLIKSMAPSNISMMPEALLDRFNEIEILDLLAYLLSKGDPEDPMFK